MSNTHSTQVTPVVTIPAGTLRVDWSVKGRGKSATYCAGLPAGHGKPGQRVALVAKHGGVTFGTLTEIRETADGVSRWDFDRDTTRMTPDVKRANRAAKASATAAYWTSDAGRETAERIEQRQQAKHAAESAPAAESVAESAPAAPAADVIAATVAALVAAGASPAVIAATVAALEAPTAPAAESAPAPAAPKQAKQGKQAKQATRTQQAMSEAPTASLSRCDACNRDRRDVKPHTGAPELVTCPRCASLDADTARVRADRHG